MICHFRNNIVSGEILKVFPSHQQHNRMTTGISIQHCSRQHSTTTKATNANDNKIKKMKLFIVYSLCLNKLHMNQIFKYLNENVKF